MSLPPPRGRETEYWFVVAPERGLAHLGLSAWPVEPSTNAFGVDPSSSPRRRRPQPLRDFEVRWRQVNGRLYELGCPPVRREELIAARLLTSPMRYKYNTTLRALASEEPSMLAAHEKLCGRNFYPATLHLVNAALHKLARLGVAGRLYRGLAGGVVPSALWQPNQSGVRGVTEAGVLSCVRTPTAALQHGSRAAGGLQATLLVVREGLGDCAADISWLSEYPDEGEHAFPPLTSLVTASAVVEGGCLLLEVQPSLSLMGGKLVEAERRLAERREGHSLGLVSRMRAGVAKANDRRAEEHAAEAAREAARRTELARAAKDLPLISRYYQAVSSTTGKKLSDAIIALVDANGKRWECAGGFVEVPLREVSEGVATVSVGCRGHVDAVRKVAVVPAAAGSHGGEGGGGGSAGGGAGAGGESTGGVDESFDQSTGGGGRVRCRDDTAAIPLEPMIAAGTFMAVLTWDPQPPSPVEQLDLHCLSSDGLHCHRAEPPTEEMFLEYSLASRGGPQILQSRLRPGSAYLLAVHLHTLSAEAQQKGSSPPKTALSASSATLVIHQHNSPPLRLTVPSSAHGSGGERGGAGLRSRLFGGGGVSAPEWWACATLRVGGGDKVDVEIVNQLCDKPPEKPAAMGKPVAGD